MQTWFVNNDEFVSNTYIICSNIYIYHLLCTLISSMVWTDWLVWTTAHGHLMEHVADSCCNINCTLLQYSASKVSDQILTDDNRLQAVEGATEPIRRESAGEARHILKLQMVQVLEAAEGKVGHGNGHLTHRDT